MIRTVMGAALAAALLGSAATISLAVAAPSGPVTMKPLTPKQMPQPQSTQAQWALSCHTTSGGGDFPEIVFKNVGTKPIGPTIGLTVMFATAPSYGTNLSRELAPGASLNMPLPDNNNGKPRGACSVKVFGQK